MRLDQGHHLIATIDVSDAAAAAEALARLGDGVAEVRLDALWPEPPAEEEAADLLLAITDVPERPTLVATLRPDRQGGRYQGDESIRLGLLVAARRIGFEAVDLENDNQDMQELLGRVRADLEPFLLSDHRFAKAPGREEGFRHLTAMQDLGSAIQKIAFPSSSFADVLRALELAHGHAAKTGRPAVMPIGHGGPQARALLALTGNRATYGHAPELPPAVAGQPSIDALRSIWRHWGLRSEDLDGAGPHWYAVIGESVAHSLSPRIQNAALAAAGRAERFAALDVPASRGALRLLLSVADRIGLRGTSITNPHKQDALKMVDADEAALTVGAVNCVRFDDGQAHGTNTDATALARLLARPASKGPILILGSGGAARAAIHAGQGHGAQVAFASRNKERGRAVEETTGAHWVPWSDRHDVEATAVVQATPLGDPTGPRAMERLPDHCSYVLEMVYGHGETSVQRLAAQNGIPCHDGRRLLLEQGMDAFRFWLDIEPDRQAMQDALEAAP